MEFLDAKHKCESDGAHLGYPKSVTENSFFADIMNGEIWIGVNDYDEENKFVTVDGFEVSYTNWYWNQPNGDGDGVVIDNNGQWWDRPNNRDYRFVCFYRISGKILYFK